LKTATAIVAVIILLSPLIFWLNGGFFHSSYLIGRNIPFGKIDKLNLNLRTWISLNDDNITYGDFFYFTDLEGRTIYKIKNGTLYYRDEKPVAKIISVHHRILDGSYELTMQSLDGKRIFKYFSKR
jgi:hypothetical protein